jgi:hypothetical protein
VLASCPYGVVVGQSKMLPILVPGVMSLQVGQRLSIRVSAASLPAKAEARPQLERKRVPYHAYRREDRLASRANLGMGPNLLKRCIPQEYAHT